MSSVVPEWLRRPRLVPIAEFKERTRAEEAWSVLQDAGIPASVVTDPDALGQPEITRVFVEKPYVVAAQDVLTPLIDD